MEEQVGPCLRGEMIDGPDMKATVSLIAPWADVAQLDGYHDGLGESRLYKLAQNDLGRGSMSVMEYLRRFDDEDDPVTLSW